MAPSTSARGDGPLRVEWRKAVRVFLSEHRDEIEGERSGGSGASAARALLSASRGADAGAAAPSGVCHSLHPPRRRFLRERLRSGGSRIFSTSSSPFSSSSCSSLSSSSTSSTFRDELLLAAHLQADLVPQTLPETPAFELAGFNRVANTVGGDLYDFVPLPDGRLAVPLRRRLGTRDVGGAHHGGDARPVPDAGLLRPVARGRRRGPQRAPLPDGRVQDVGAAKLLPPASSCSSRPTVPGRRGGRASSRS